MEDFRGKTIMNRLRKLLGKCLTYTQFKKESVESSSWYFGPYIQAGHKITEIWLQDFWKTHKRWI